MHCPGKKCLLIALAVPLVVLASVICWEVLRLREPVYHGRPLHAWLEGLDYGEHTRQGSASRLAIQKMGTNALPALIDYLRYHDLPGKRQYAWVVHNVLRHGGVDFELDWHRRAARACAELGTNAQPASAALVEVSRDPDAAGDVIKAFYTMLPASAPTLLNLLATGQPRARTGAAQALASCLDNAALGTSVATALTNALQDPDLGVRQAAATSLAVATNKSGFVLPALMQALANTNGSVLIAVISSTKKLVGKPAVMLPQLTRALRHPDEMVRNYAVESLGDLGAAAKPAVPELLELWREIASYPNSAAWPMYWLLGERTRIALKRIDPVAALGEWSGAINHGSPRLRENALLAMGTLDPETVNRPDVILGLLEASRDTNSTIRQAAFFVLGWVAPECKEVIPRLKQARAGEMPELASALNGLTGSLVGFHGDAKQFIPFLLAGLEDPNEFTRNACTNALAKIDPEATPKGGSRKVINP